MSTPVLHEATHPLDIAWVREQFPSLHLEVNGQRAAFLELSYVPLIAALSLLTMLAGVPAGARIPDQ